MTSQTTYATSETKLPATIKFDMQPYGAMILGDLRWDTESERDWNNGGPDRVRTILRGTVIEGTERGYLFGASSAKDIKGQSRTVYGVRPDEIESGLIVRVAG